jgi:hypothetical protein
MDLPPGRNLSDLTRGILAVRDSDPIYRSTTSRVPRPESAPPEEDANDGDASRLVEPCHRARH